MCLLPSLLTGFMRSTAEAANSCFPGCVCCLRSSQFSWDQRRWQQIPASQGVFAAFALRRFHGVNGRGSKFLLPRVYLLPSLLTGFMGSTAEAANSCFYGMFAAFALRRFHGVNGRGSNFLLPRVCLLPSRFAVFMGSMAEAANFCFPGRVCCLCINRRIMV